MTATNSSLAPYYDGWARYNSLLVEAIAPLSAEQLALGAAPNLHPVWRLAAHIIGARSGWYTQFLMEPPPAAVTSRWDRDGVTRARPPTAG